MVKGQRFAATKGGFTLIELVVVVAIIAVLAGIAVPLVSNEVDDARASRAATDLKTVANAFTTYRTHTGIWPSNVPITGPASYTNTSEACSAFTCLYANTMTVPGWKGPYLNSGFKINGVWNVAGTNLGEGLLDPWGHPYQVFWYRPGQQLGEGGGIVLVSMGLNGVVNTSRLNAANNQEQGDDLLFVLTRRL